MVIVLGAMNEEISAIEKKISGEQKHEWKGFSYLSGKIAGMEVLVAKSGVGKVLSAVFTQYLLEKYSPSALIFCGLAGALHPDLSIGDIVVSKDLVQHDLDATRFGFARGQVPYTDFRFYEADPVLVSLSLEFKPETGRVFAGRILTGDQFIAHAQDEKLEYLTKELEGWAVEMEGAAAAQVCLIHNVPFVVARIISDLADGKDGMNFGEFLPVAAAKTAAFAHYLVERIASRTTT